MRPTLVVLTTLALALAACDDGEETEHEEDLAAEGCEHGEEGPVQPVTAAAPEAAPAIQSYAHHRIDITLVSGADGNTGSVAFNAAEAGDYYFFLTDDVPFTVSAGGSSIEIEATEPVDICTAIAVQHIVELPAGEAILTLGPTPLSLVGLVFEAAGEEHDHEH